MTVASAWVSNKILVGWSILWQSATKDFINGEFGIFIPNYSKIEAIEKFALAKSDEDLSLHNSLMYDLWSV